jgi:hypothetical protein
MENALLMTGLTVGGILAFPLFLEWLRKFQVGLAIITTMLVTLYGFAAHSPAAHHIQSMLNIIPETFIAAVENAEDGLAKLGSEYYNAFRG